MAIDAMLTPIPRWLEPPDSDKPYVEIVHGRRERKMSPKRTHGMLQGRLPGSIIAAAAPARISSTCSRRSTIGPPGAAR